MIRELTASDDFIKELVYWIKNEGPDREAYPQTARLFRNIHECYTNKMPIKRFRELLLHLFGAKFKHDSMCGLLHLCSKGEAGYYEMFDKVLTKYISANPAVEKWDRFFHALAGTRSLRYRRDFYKTLMFDELEESGERLKVLYVGPGSGRILGELFEIIPSEFYTVDCLDADRNSIFYNTCLMMEYLEDTTFHLNELDFFKPASQYDLVICPMALDTLKEEAMTAHLNKLFALTKSGGKVVCSVFSDKNPSRIFYNLMGWPVINYKAETFERIAFQAGAQETMISQLDAEDHTSLFVQIDV